MSGSTSPMKLVHAGSLSDCLVHFRSLADCIVINAQLLDIRSFGALAPAVLSTLSDAAGGMLLDVDSLKDTSSGELEQVRNLLAASGTSVMLLATGVDEAHASFLEITTDGAVQGVVANGRPHSARLFFWGAAGLARELAGQTYRRDNAEALGLIVAHGTDDGILMTFDQGPSFIRVQVGGCSVFVWATRSVLDVSRLHDDANTRAPLGYGRSDRCPFFCRGSSPNTPRPIPAPTSLSRECRGTPLKPLSLTESRCADTGRMVTFNANTMRTAHRSSQLIS